MKNAKKENVAPTGKFLKIVCIHFTPQDCRARVNVNATHVKKKQFSKALIDEIPGGRVLKPYQVPLLAVLIRFAFAMTAAPTAVLLE